MDTQIADIFKIGSAPIGEAFSLIQLLLIFGHSLTLGLILTYVSYLSSIFQDQKKEEQKRFKRRRRHFLGATNILFLCVGLTGIMILVNNNVARAFAIGAAIGLCRFKVRLDEKSNDSNLLFGIIVGMACGLVNIPVAYIVTGIYAVLQGVIMIVFKALSKEKNVLDDSSKS